ncbi:MAG: hypothetical protein ACYDBJ_17160 [Aggregatilineales bacterium]
MQIVSQSATLSHSLFPPHRLLLPPPKIAGLLPAHAESLHRSDTPTAKPFIYADPRLADLSDKTRIDLDKLVTTLLKVTVGLLVDDLSEAEFTIASETFHRRVKALYHGAIVGDAKPMTSPFAYTRQRMDEKIDQMVAQSKVHLAETRERIAQELVALHARDGE